MTLLFIFTVLIGTVLMAFLAAGKPGRVAKRWSNALIVMTVVYFCLLLAGLSYAGWFRVA
jgi:hypothetical protein